MSEQPLPLPGGGDEAESLDFGAAQPVIAELMRSVERHAESLARRVREDFELISRCEALRRIVGGARRFPTADAIGPPGGVAVDSTFPPEGGVDMVVGSLIGVVAGYVAYRVPEGWGQRDKRFIVARTLLVEKQEEATKIASIYSKLLERLLVLRLVTELLPEGSVVLIDGEIVPYTLIFTRIKTRPKRRLDDVTAKVLEVAAERKIALIGVVKRSYTTLLNAYATGCGSRLRLNDKAVFSIVLRPGEVAEIGRFAEVLPAYASTLQNGSRLARVVEERLRERGSYGEIVVGYYKPRRVPQSWQAVKIEVYAPWLDDPLGAAASHLDGLTSPATGLPYPIDLIDEVVRIEARALEVVRYRLVRLLRERLQEQGVPDAHALTLTLHTNPEKRYLYQPRRGR